MKRGALLIAVAMSLTACAGSETGKEAGLGISTLDTISKEDKENDKWFGSYYGEKRCTWDSVCPDEDKESSPLGW